MKYSWLCSCALFAVGTTLCHAQKEEGAIKDSEFIIEKEKKNKINQEPRLFFKAPARIVKSKQQSLGKVQALGPTSLPLDPETQIGFTFARNPKTAAVAALPSFCSLGMGLHLLPAIELSCYPFLQKQKKEHLLHVTYIPAYWHENGKEGMFAFQSQGKFKIGAILVDPEVHYQYAWYQCQPKTTSYACSIHQGTGHLHVQYVNASATHEGKIEYNLLAYQSEKISEQFLKLQYKWIKQLGVYALHIKSYNDIAGYKSQSTPSQITRAILSLKPGLTIDFSKKLQLKTCIKATYHYGPMQLHSSCSSLAFYPMVQLSHSTSSWFNPYISIKGLGIGNSVQPLHLQNIVAKNPFLTADYTLKHYQKSLHIHLGSKGAIVPGTPLYGDSKETARISYHCYTVYRHFNNLPKIVATQHPLLYKLCYNAKLEKLLKPTVILHYNDLKLGLHGTLKIQGYYRIVDNNTEIPFINNKPNVKAKLTTVYQVHPKFLLRAIVYLYRIPTLCDEEGNPKSNGRKTVGFATALGGSYLFAPKFSAFLTMGNQLYNYKFVHYMGYRSNRFHITGGIIYRW